MEEPGGGYDISEESFLSERGEDKRQQTGVCFQLHCYELASRDFPYK